MKIIEPGRDEFDTYCSRCGCHFSYTLEELKLQYPLKYIRCPHCGQEVYHKDQSNFNYNPNPLDPIIYTTDTSDFQAIHKLSPSEITNISYNNIDTSITPTNEEVPHSIGDK